MWFIPSFGTGRAARVRRPGRSRPAPSRNPGHPRLGVEPLEDRTVPTIIVVNTFADIAAPPAGQISLRSALAQAADASHPDADTIRLPAGTYTLALGQLTIDDPIKVTIQSDGGPATIDAQGASRVFEVFAGSEVVFQDLTITGGSAIGGGGIACFGTLTLTNSTLSGNSASADGGGISNFGTLTLTNSTLSGNSASLGGGIYNFHTLTLTNSTLSGNSADAGGGIFNSSPSTLTLTNSTLSGNSAGGRGGGIANSGTATATVTNSTLSGNSADTGGGIYNSFGTLTLTDSTLSGNSATQQGGGIFNRGTATLTGSTISGNSATIRGGGIFNFDTAILSVIDSTISANSATKDVVLITSGDGGGIYNRGTATLTGSTLSGNSAAQDGGGIFNNGTATLTDCTVRGNSAAGSGGGVDSTNGTLTSTRSVISRNTASRGGGVSSLTGGRLTFTDSEVSDNTASRIGGGVYSIAFLTITGGSISGNSAGEVGGGFWGTGTITGCAIEDNVGEGVYLVATSGEQLLGNTITGNSRSGVILAESIGLGVTNSLIGTLTAGNVIAFNGGPGVAVVGSSAGIAIRGNAIYGNAGPGIDLGNNGLTANDPGDADNGPNHLQNAPVLVLARSDAAGTTVSGTLNSTANTRFLLDFYASPPAGSPPGMTYVGTALVQTEGSGNVVFEVTLTTPVAVGWGITATATTTATAPFGDTSEFALGVPVFASTPPNRPPVIGAQTFSINEGSPNDTAVGTVLASDPDTGQALSYQITAGNTGGAFRINSSTGQITVANSAALDFETTPVFTLTVQVTDNGSPALSSTATITITLANLNDAPVHRVPSFPQSVDKNRTLTFSSGKGNVVSVSDPDGATALIQVSLTVFHGTLTLASTAGLTFLVGDGRDDTTLTFQGTVTAVNAALNGLTYTPGKGYVGLDTLTITTNDLGSGLGDPLIASDLVTILVGLDKKK